MKVVVIVVNGFHLGYLGCYGNEWIDTPALDRLAAEAVVFDQHYADCADATGARRAWRTGRHSLPSADDRGPVLAEPPADLLDLLRGQQVPTSLITQADPSGFASGWDQVKIVAIAEADHTFQHTFSAVQTNLRQLARRERGLLWIELAALLPPWQVPEEVFNRYFQALPDDEEATEEEAETESLHPWTGLPPCTVDAADETTFLRLQSTYAAAVTHLDDWLGRVLHKWEELGLDDEACLALTADHGFVLGERGAVGDHRAWLHDERVHVPLLVRLPKAEEAGRRVLALTQHIDLMPTLLDLFGVPLPPVHGHSLLPLLRGQVESVRPYGCAGLRIGEAVEWALRTPDWGFVLPVRPAPDDAGRGPQLYVKPDDRWEVNNVLQHHLDFAEHLEQSLRGFVAATRQPGPLQAPSLKDIEEITAEATSPSTEGGKS